MENQIIIRAAVSSDAAAIAQVHVDSWQSTYAGTIDAAYLAALSVQRRQQMWTEVLTSRKLRCHEMVAVDIVGKVVGFVSGGPNRSNHASAGHEAEPDGEIYALYLLAEFQKQGLGKKLFLTGLQRLQADGFYSCKVWVLKDNPATAFYERLGGQMYEDKMVDIGGACYLEAGFRWNDLGEILGKQLPGFRHGAIKYFEEIQEPDVPAYPGSNELLSVGSPFSRYFDFTRLGIHHEILLPGRRTSWPHAESTEDEFAYVIQGNPHVWLDGKLFPLKPGDGVGFKAGSGIGHTFMNQSQETVRLLVIGDRSRSDNRVYYAAHPERNEEIKAKGIYWEGHPVRR